MSDKSKHKIAWLVLLAIVLAVAAVIAIPVYLIQPFAPQTERNLQIAFLLKNWSPVVTPVAALISIALCVFLWVDSKRLFGKVLLIFPLSLVLLCAWFARQNHFEWMFNPLAQSSFTKAGAADFVADEEMVLAVEINGEAVAYPVNQLAYHHLVQDVVGGTPITATY